MKVMMNKHHYLHMDKGNLEVADLEAHPEVTVLALEAVAEGEAMAEGETVVVVEDEE